MLIDPKKWQDRRIKEHVEALALRHPSDMYTSDEIALNLIFAGCITELPQSYNTFFFTAQYLRETGHIWHFNTQKPIVHTSLVQFSEWMALFKKDDYIFLNKLEEIYRQYGKNHLLSLNSRVYHHI